MGVGEYKLVTVDSTSHPLLQTGGLYFVDVLAPIEGLFNYIYYPASTLTNDVTLVQSFDLGNTWSLRGSGPSTEYEAFEVQGTPFASAVLEPSSLTMLGLGSLGLVGYGWRRRKHAAA